MTSCPGVPRTEGSPGCRTFRAKARAVSSTPGRAGHPAGGGLPGQVEDTQFGQMFPAVPSMGDYRSTEHPQRFLSLSPSVTDTSTEAQASAGQHVISRGLPPAPWAPNSMLQPLPPLHSPSGLPLLQGLPERFFMPSQTLPPTPSGISPPQQHLTPRSSAHRPLGIRGIFTG